MDVAQLLESAYREYHRSHHRDRDPVQFAHRYSNRRDQEVVAFLAALLSYGNVKIILNSVNFLLEALGRSPYETLLVGGVEIPKFRHRFSTDEDFLVVAHWLTAILRSHNSLENFFAESKEFSMQGKLASFVDRLRQTPLPVNLRRLKSKRERSLKYLISSPNQGSACKRLNMFLRWVVRRDDGIDLGLWTKVHSRELLLPVDTHLLKIVRHLGWTKSKQATWKVAEASTAILRKYDAEDPVRFDFSLCHLSMTGNFKRQFEKKPIVSVYTHLNRSKFSW